MENADLVLVLIVTAIGSFAGGILFGMWLFKRIGRSHDATVIKVKPSQAKNPVNPIFRNDKLDLGAIPLSGKFQPTAPNRIGLSNLIRDLESDDPEAKRHETIMKVIN